jgi:putative ABC transport system permease protein
MAMPNQSGIAFLLASLALQNLARRKARTLLLVAAVAVCSGAVFTGAVLMLSIESSMAVGLTRLGADMLLVPTGTLTNITAALLTAEPTDLTLDDGVLARIETLKGVQRAAPQLIFRTDAAGYRGRGDLLDLIAFDPARDITVQPWLEQRLDRPLRNGDIIVGGRREDALGSQLLLFGWPLTVYGRLGKTAVGTHERGVFLTFATLAEMRMTMQQICGAKAPLEPNKLSGILLQLKPGATSEQVRFTVLANFPDIKVVSGESMLTSIRQGLSSLLSGVLALMAIMFVSSALMMTVLFSAIITERRRELGLLRAIGARRGQIVGTLLIEAGLATAAGGLVGSLLGLFLLRVYEHSLVYHLNSIGIPFLWLSHGTMGLIAVLCILFNSLVGAAGALYPAWRASGLEPYDLIRSEI